VFVQQRNSLNESDSKAEHACRQSMAKAGYAFGDAPASFHWSQLVNPLGDKDAAITAYELLLTQEPENKSALEGLAFIYQTLGNFEKAYRFRQSLRQIEANGMGIDVTAHPEVVSYLLSKTGEAPQPERVPVDYVSALFDSYAENFDNQLCDLLDYKGHLLVEKACRQACDEIFAAKDELCALDIGCGTGLTGARIQDLFTVIDGVDLSPNMLDIARSRNVYTKLVNADYQHYLSKNLKKYEVITASDVLIYEGDLHKTLALVFGSLAKDGYFIFTVEKGATDHFCLRNTGRFQHNTDYVSGLAKKCGFSIEVMRDVELRVDEGQGVSGVIFTLKR